MPEGWHPPPRPDIESHEAEAWKATGWAALFLIIWGILWGMAFFVNNPGAVNNTGVFVGGIPCALLGILFAVGAAQLWKKSGVTYSAARASYDIAMQHWDSQYYCFRDDVVYTPG